MGERRRWMEAFSVLSLFDVDSPLLYGYFDDLTELRSTLAVQLFVTTQLSILRREAITMDRCARGTASITDEGQARESSTLIEKLFVGEAGEAKILPPGSLLLAAVPIEDIGKKPPRLLLGGSFSALQRAPLRKAR